MIEQKDQDKFNEFIEIYKELQKSILEKSEIMGKLETDIKSDLLKLESTREQEQEFLVRLREQYDISDISDLYQLLDKKNKN